MHSSEKEYYCHECGEDFRGPSFFKHLKSRRHYENVLYHFHELHNRNFSHLIADREPDSDDPSLGTIPVATRDPKADEHAANFLRSLSQFLDMWYLEYHFRTASTRSGVRVVISVSKMDHK